MGKRVNIVGNRYGRLVVKSYVGNTANYVTLWLCVCDCGNEVIKRQNTLSSGNTKSCGCLRIETMKKRKTTHGMKNTRLYGIWHGMKNRCYNKNDKKYGHYGSRGITVSDEWHEFENFYKWAIANGYKEDIGENGINNISIDRIDNDKGYSEKNCRFTDIYTQNKNRRNVNFAA